MIACAHTGSGKTAAFALPILQQLSQNPFGVYALVLTPTRHALPTMESNQILCSQLLLQHERQADRPLMLLHGFHGHPAALSVGL